MISNLTLVGCIFSLLVSLILPVALISVFAIKNKGRRVISAWWLGAAGFFVTQILIRVPILTVLQTQPWFMDFSNHHGFLFAFSLAFTAGLFELAGRFAAAKLMQRKNNLTCTRSLAAGLGHGGIEAMVLIGITYLNNILYILMINAGTFDSLVAEAAKTGLDVSSLWQIKDQLLNTAPILFFLGGFERILAMVCHMAMSMLVCCGVHTGKAGKYVLTCLGIHTMIDLTAGISLMIGKGLSQGAAYGIIYAILTAAAIVSILVIRKIRQIWREMEENHV